MTVKIPEDKKDRSLYCSCAPLKRVYVEGLGTQLTCSGTAVLFYTSKNYRRAYVVSERSEPELGAHAMRGRLPLVRDGVFVLGFFEARRFDILKRLVKNLEDLAGKKIYGYGTDFWLTAAACVDAVSLRKRQATREWAEALLERNGMRERRLNESH